MVKGSAAASGIDCAVGREAAAPRGPLSISATVRPAEWDEYVRRHPDATPYHTLAWRTVFEHVFGHRTHYVTASRSGRPVGILPMVEMRSWLFGRFMVSLPFVNYGGVLADDGEAREALLQAGTHLSRTGGLRHLELRHRERMFPSLPSKSHKAAMRLALASDPEAMWRMLDRKVRNQVRKAQRHLAASVGGAELLPEFYTVLAANMRDLGTPVYHRHLFATVLELFPKDATIAIVRLGTRPIAGAMGLGWRETFEVPWAASLRRDAALCPNMLLYWTLICHAIGTRRQVFDFGRSSPDAGTYRFKAQWGAQPDPLCWEYVLLQDCGIPDQGPGNPRFHWLIEQWKRMPLAAATRLGPGIVRNIP
jgi:FemAB-related protein (PEP-CTERM system-associated)